MDRRVAAAIACAAVLAAASTALAVDRDTVMATAKSYATHVWQSTQANVTASCSSSYRSDYAPGTNVGVCYDWGGWKSLDEFDAEIAAGQGAGSHSRHGILSCTTGVDCSGYVSKCWNEDQYTTSSVDRISKKISTSELKKGDILNKAGSHMVLFSHYAGNGAPVFYEASGSASKVRLNTSGGWSYLNGYTARRYNNIVESAGPVCPAPTEITAFPFTDTRDTGASTCDRFDAYSCAPKTKESGPEYVYKVAVPRAGTLTAAVTCGTGVDIDIHLLSANDPNSCIARNDKKIAVKVAAGVYYLAADTFVSSAGAEYDGAFKLDVSFAPDGTVQPDGGTADAGAQDAGTDAGAAVDGIARGVIYEDQGNGDMTKRVGGATVKIAETGAQATAGAADGAWSFTLPAGSYTVQASAAGYAAGSAACAVVAGATAWCSIGLKPSAPQFIDIPSFPYTDTRTTAGSARDAWNSYSCAATTGEKGPENVYRFTVTGNGKVAATVTDGTGVDVDVHLLSGPDPSACIARNDTTISADITAGTYYLSVDTFSNAGGTEYPGQYTLQATFNPAGTGTGDLVGTFWNTYYYLAMESDYTGTKDTALNDMSCKAIVTVPSKFSDSVCIEGSGKLADGRVINYAGTCSCGRACPTGGIVCYSVLDPVKYPWGAGASSNALTPLRSWAVDKTVLPLGTVVYAAEWDGVAVPAVDGIGGFVHDGCFVADDIGGAIKGNHYDFFAGTKTMWQDLEKIFPTQSSFTVYKNSPRCAYLTP